MTQEMMALYKIMFDPHFNQTSQWSRFESCAHIYICLSTIAVSCIILKIKIKMRSVDLYNNIN